MFPFAMSLTVAPSFVSPVVVTVEGLDWDTNAVVATGSTTADVVAVRDASGHLRLMRP